MAKKKPLKRNKSAPAKRGNKKPKASSTSQVSSFDSLAGLFTDEDPSTVTDRMWIFARDLVGTGKRPQEAAATRLEKASDLGTIMRRSNHGRIHCDSAKD